MALTRKHKILLCSCLIAGVGTLLYFVNPVGAAWMPKCMLYVLTGLKCPTCGATRGAHALLHGEFAKAFDYNPLMPVLVVLAAAAILAYMLYPERHKLYIRLTYAYLAVYCVWFVVRNVIGV